MRRSHRPRRTPLTRRPWAALAAGIALGCNAEGAAFSALSDDVERDGWVDTAHAVAGDGATSFASDRSEISPGAGIAQPSQPLFFERGFDAGPVTSVVAEHLLSLSRFRGLVSTRVAGPGAPRVEASVPLGGLPVGLFVSDGMAAVLVVDPVDSGCFVDDCPGTQTSRVVLVDVRDPARPRALGEQRFEGTLSAARQVGGALHVLSHTIVDCISCAQAPDTDYRWVVFDRSTPSELGPPRVTRVAGSPFFDAERLFLLSPGTSGGEGPHELRLAALSEAEPTLSAPVALRGFVGQVMLAGDRLRVTYGGEPLDIDTFELGAGTATLLGRGSLALPDGEYFWRLVVDGDRAVAMLEPSRQLALIDFSDPIAPRIASRLELDVSESDVTFAGDRVLVVGGSTLAADAPPADTIARGPQALVLVDVADFAAPRVLDRVNLGSFDSVHESPLELRGERALVGYYEEFPTVLYGAKPERGDCGKAMRRLLGYDISSGRLVPAFAFDRLDADARVEAVGDEWWVASSVSVSRYAESAGVAPSPRLELTRSVDRLRALSGGAALFVEDFASNARALELSSGSSPMAALDTLDIATEVGLAPGGCDERRRWNAPLMEAGGALYALRFHLPSSGAGAAAATLHVLDTPPSLLASPPALPADAQPPRSLELEPLAAGEDYLGAIQTDRALLIARGRRDDAPLQPGYDPRSLFAIGDTDPTAAEQLPDFVGGGSYAWEEGLHPDARLSYDVVDLSDPAAPVLASRLDIDPALATAGFFRALRGVTRDTRWGFHVEGLVAGPAVVSGSIIAGQHSEPAARGLFRFFLDRFDLSEPNAPVQLPPVEIPGSVLGFDAEAGALITLETLRLRAPADSPACEAYRPEGCPILRRALNALVVDDARATRVGRLLLDTDERQIGGLAVSNTRVYYATRSSEPAHGSVGPVALRELTIERVVLRDGRFERLPSFDVASASGGAPMSWDNFSARGDRVLWSSSGQLFVVDFAGAEPRLEAHDIGPWGCGSLDLDGDTAYCAQGQAGYVKVVLGEP